MIGGGRMKAKEAMKTIGDWISKETHKRKYNKVEIAKLSEALIHLKYITEQQGNGWIPASERLPKEDGNYLVTMKHKKFNQTKTTSMDFNGEFLFNDYFEKAWWEVTAWQPLPPAWKGEKNE